MNPWFVTGFLDGEGCLFLTILGILSLVLVDKRNFGFQLHYIKKDEALLIAFKNYFNMAGYIAKHREDSLIFRASSKEDLIVVINHFNKYNLITQKCADFELWKKAFYIVQNKGHLTMKGLEKLVAIKSSLNRGLSDELKSAFPNASLITGEDTERPLVENKEIPDPYWLAGFTSGEGCLAVSVRKSATYKLNERVELIFQITQHTRDEVLIRSLIKYFDCGRVSKTREIIDYQVSRFSDLENKIIPFFKEYQILGAKSKDFNDFCNVNQIVKEKKYLTKEGLEQIKKIKDGMNRRR